MLNLTVNGLYVSIWSRITEVHTSFDWIEKEMGRGGVKEIKFLKLGHPLLFEQIFNIQKP